MNFFVSKFKSLKKVFFISEKVKGRNVFFGVFNSSKYELKN